jgi:CHAT domain-containing protein/Tfp pilus assembly protein PilF
VVVSLHNILRVQLQRLNDYYGSARTASQCHEILTEEFKNDTLLAHTFRLWGLSLEKMSKYPEAHEKYIQARSLYDTLGMEQYVMLTEQYIINASWYTGNFKKALSLQNRLIEKAKQAGNMQQLIFGYATLGLIYNSLGDTKKALKIEYQAMELAQEVRDSINLAGIYSNTGFVLKNMGDYSKAMKHFREAAAIDQRLNSTAGMASDFKNIGELYLKLGKPGNALENFEKAIGLGEKIKDPFIITGTLLGLGDVFFETGKLDSSMVFFKRAESMAERSSLMDLLWFAKYRLASIYHRMGRHEQAVKNYKESIQIIEEMRAGLSLGGAGSAFLQNKMAVYRDLVDLLVDIKRQSQAFKFVERARARSFMDILGNKNLAETKKGPPELMAREAAFRDSIRAASAELGRLKSSKQRQKSAAEIKKTGDRLFRLRSRHQEVLARIKQENAEMANLVGVDPLSLSEIQKYLDKRTALLSYFISGRRIYVWAITAGQVNVYWSEVPLRELEAGIREMRQGLEDLRDVSEVSRLLYRILIKPCLPSLQGITTLCIIPYGPMHYLPFAALKGENGYLIDQYRLYYNISASVFGLCMEKQKSGSQRVLAFGNPDLGDPNMALPFAEREVKSLRRTFRSVEFFLNDNATESRFKSIEKRFGIIHFACHGEFEERSPMYSGLLLSQDSQSDGRLEVHEIFDLDLRSNLVVLSACQTGLGKVTSGDDLIGLTTSFIYAGANSVISSLWRVDDVATAVMIKRFYRYIRKQNKAEALRKAQILVRNKINPHPAYWAAFKLSGAN